MSEQLENAKALLRSGGCCFVYVDKIKTISSDESGISFLARLFSQGIDMSEGAVADKIIGKAAALLLCGLEVGEVYAETVSRHAVEVFGEYGIKLEFGKVVADIINRTGDGICPMEQAVREISDPVKACAAINATLERLRKKAN